MELVNIDLVDVLRCAFIVWLNIALMFSVAVEYICPLYKRIFNIYL